MSADLLRATELLELVRAGDTLSVERKRRRLVGLRSARRGLLRELDDLDSLIARDTIAVEDHDISLSRGGDQ